VAEAPASKVELLPTLLVGELEGVGDNAFDLLIQFIQKARAQCAAEADIERVLAGAKTSNYDHLVRTLRSNFEGGAE
jgi:hypothetical protein